MPGQSSPFFLANKDSDVRTVLVNTAALDAGYAISYTGTLPNPGEAIQGIARQSGVVGEYIGVTTHNTASAIVEVAVVKGDELAAGNGAKLTLAASGDYIVARALMDGDANSFITVELKSEAIKA